MVAVTPRAIMKRINRRLWRPDDGGYSQLHEGRGVWHQGSWYPDHNLGRYYIIDHQRNFLTHSHLDLEDFAREMGVMSNSEKIAE